MTNWYDNEITRGILKAKYLHEGEDSFENLVDRVSSIFGDIKDEVKTAMLNADITPAGRILYGAGYKDDRKVSLSNCYIVGNVPEDSLESISQIDYEISRIGSMGGGVGIALDNIRPKGTKVNNSARISDGVSFVLNKINNTGENIGQYTRRMAIMVALICNHPDIFEFLHVKENNQKLSAMNISIKFTDDFMKAVKNNEDYELKFEVKSTGEVVNKTINARDFFKEFCEVNRDWGDPGCIFIDRVKNYNLLSGYNDYSIDVSNPCVTGRTPILTDKGYKRIDSLVGVNTRIWNGNQWSNVTPKVTGHNQKMLNIGVSNGMELDCTRYHKFILADGRRVKAENLLVGDKLEKWTYPVIDCGVYDTNHDAYTNGFYSGDGTKCKNEIAIYGDKEVVIPFLNTTHVLSQKTRKVAVLAETPLGKSYVPSTDMSVKYRLEWLAGLIDSDGCINDIGGSIAISSVDKDFLAQVQIMISTLGCFSSVGVMHEAGIKQLPLNDGSGLLGKFVCKESYRLTISAWEVKKLLELGLCLHRINVNPNPNRNASRFITITSIREISDEEIVYCFNEPINHSGIFNGIMTAQCAEFFGNRGNSCNLGSINLYNVVDNKFTKDASVNVEKLEKLVRLGVRMLNKTLDYGYSMQPLDLNRACIDDWRSIGLGVFGVADMFIAMGIKYGSEESLKVISDVFDTMNVVALDESAEIAKETKTFGKYSWSKTNKSPIIQALKLGHKPVYDKIKKYGLANGTLLSIAPTGTISLFMGGLSGGCEPLFKVGYERTTHSSEDEGKHFTVFARSVKDLIEYSKLGSNITIDEVKAKFPFIVESHEIKPIDRIAMQSIMQDYTDNAISSTINLPEGTSADTIFDIYVKAWEQGLKGVTVFVDNCKRGNILGVNTNKKEEEIKSVVTYDTVSPISRRSTAEVAGKTYRLRTACVDKFYITVNKTDEGDVFEIFANPSGGCQANITTITRLISMSLRSGVKVDEIINELGSMKCPACQALRRRGEKDVELSCGNALATALRKAYKDDYVAPVVVKEDNTAVTVDNSRGLYECPECHQKTLRLEAKCSTCSNCGYSKCE